MNITKQVFNNNISLYSSELNKDIDNIILKKLKDIYEGYCKGNCFVMNNSINIINRTIGKIETHEGKNVIKYDVKYSCDILSPTKGEQIEVIVSNVNKMGIISYIKIDDKYLKSDIAFDNSPLIVIIPNDLLLSHNISDIHIGQKLKVEIIGFRIKFRNDKIQVVCKII
tara:strand:- start:238 stop:744 length:507 start_codon:yes stop_codon:yes gene_type:complete